MTAFNKNYEGVGGHCINLTVCDEQGRPERGRPIAPGQVRRQQRGRHAQRHDRRPAPKDVATIFTNGRSRRASTVSPNTDDLDVAEMSYAIGGGGVGTTFMMAPPLLKTGHKKLYMIGVDTPTIELLPKVMEPMLKSYGAEFVGLSKVPGWHDRLPAVHPRGRGRGRRRRDPAARRERSGPGAAGRAAARHEARLLRQPRHVRQRRRQVVRQVRQADLVQRRAATASPATRRGGRSCPP